MDRAGRGAQFRARLAATSTYSLAKKTGIIGERLNMELRADFFNIFNHAEFQMPTLDFQDTHFGQVTSTYDPRIIQLAVVVSF